MQHGFTDSLATRYDLGYVEPLKRDYRLQPRGQHESQLASE
jgi:hypothetical protein